MKLKSLSDYKENRQNGLNIQQRGQLQLSIQARQQKLSCLIYVLFYTAVHLILVKG